MISLKDEDEAKILDLLESKKTLHYTELVPVLNVGVETARHRCIEISLKYPDNIDYRKGLLVLKKAFSTDSLPPEKRIAALQKSLELKEQLLQKKERIEKKLKTNHLPHLERAILEADLQKIKEEFDKLMRLLSEK